MGRNAVKLGILGVGLLFVAGCLGQTDNQPSGDHTTIIPITTGGDSGMTVLLCVGFFISLISIGFGVWSFMDRKLSRVRDQKEAIIAHAITYNVPLLRINNEYFAPPPGMLKSVDTRQHAMLD